MKDNLQEAVARPNEVTDEVTAKVLCPLDHKIHHDLSSEVESGQTPQ